MRYSVQPRDQIFVKCYRFLSFYQNIGKNIGKKLVKAYAVNTVRNFLIMVNNLLQLHLKLLRKKQFKKSRSNW